MRAGQRRESVERDRSLRKEPGHAGADAKAELDSCREASGNAYRLGVFGRGPPHRQPVRANPLPLLNEHAIGLEEGANTRALPAGDIFENRRQHGERATAENGTPGDLRNMRRLGDGDGQAVARIDLQHHVNIGAAVARIDDVIGADYQFRQQLIENRNFAVAGCGPDDGVDFARGAVTELRAVDVIGWNNAFESGVDHFDGRGGKNVEVKGVAVDAGGKDL